MKELFVRVPEETSELVINLLVQLGAEVKEKPSVSKKEKANGISPTLLFGKWKDLDINPKELRKKTWDRSHKF